MQYWAVSNVERYQKMQDNHDDNNELSEIDLDNNQHHKNFLKAIYKSNNSQSDKRPVHTNKDILSMC